MKSEVDTMQSRKINNFQRLLAVLLSFLMVFSLCGTELVPVSRAVGNTQQETQQETQVETREEIKARLMRQIRYEGWDPYSADMTLDEFYALMELFDERKLPLGPTNVSGFGDANMGGPSIEGEANIIPRTMFMFRGLPLDGSIDYKNGDAPLPYNDDGSYGYPNYPAGLDPYGLGYQVPPTNWQGVPLGAGKTQVVIAVEGQNENDSNIAGNVVQSLFKNYRSEYGYYVRKVTAENNEATVLGAIKLSNKIVYYYLTDEKQSTEVSTTVLEDGKKFIVEYSPIEHTLEYEVRRDTVNGDDITNDLINGNVLGTDLSDTWENIVFGVNRPNKTDGSAYSFTASAPYGYTVEFYLVKTTDEETGDDTGEKTWGTPAALLGMDSAGSFEAVNGGWALGMEPDYKNGTKNDATIIPGNGGPSTLTMSGNIFNNGVHHDRKLIAVVHDNPQPTFFVAPIYHNTDNVGGRGASAVSFINAKDSSGATVTVPYDYEDVYMSVMGRPSKYTGYSLLNTDNRNTVNGNVVPSNGSWNWDYASSPLAMTKDPTDGTYSYQWTWQSNSGSGGHTLDSLEINGVAVMIPFYFKYEAGSTTPATHNRWYTETTLPDGAKLLVEHLMSFTNGTQHVYRFTVTGARSNVTVSAMNLIQGTGSPEFVTYQLTGVTDGNGATAIEYYCKMGTWISTPQGNINVNSNENGIDFRGDNGSYGASIRFRLADGYSNPYYLWEATRAGVIGDQASAKRDDDGNVILTELNPVIPLDGFSGTMDSEHVYGPDNDGWYYIRVTTQGDYKIALLTIGAKQVRYVVRYIPGTIPKSTRVPEGMPTFDHTGESDFEITGDIADQYDTKKGAYYDVTIDNVIILPSDIPSDPSSKYKFVDWVLVDEKNNAIPGPDGKGYHYSVTHINLNDVIKYAIQNDLLGGAATDIYVLRLMPTWAPIENPFHYNVALNWVDAQGTLHTEYFSEYWKQVLTDWSISESGNLTVQIIQDATPFKDWIANHPTYTFWDEVNTNSALYEYYQTHGIDVNTATAEEKQAAYDAMSAEMAKAIQTYLPFLTAEGMKQQYNDILGALCTRDISGTGVNGAPLPSGMKNGTDDFWRLGGYAYQVFEDYATIVVWMREDKGGLAFSKNVRPESYLLDEDFYFTVSQVMTAFGTPLSGVYKAYPETRYDENGKKIDRRDSDAWLVTFTDGTITNIVKNDGSHASTTYFTLKHGEKIELYVPAGEYTITELGSKSGGTYRVEVKYDGESAAPTLSSGWTLPGESDNTLLKGYEKTVCTHTGPVHGTHSGVSQVSATVRFEIGEANMVQTLQFTNMTSAVSVEKKVDATDENKEELQEWLDENRNQQFHFKVTLIVPEGYEPLYNNGSPYFTLNIYDAVTGVCIGQDKLYVYKDAYGAWIGEIDLYNDQRADVVMSPPNDGKTLYAHRYVWDTDIGDFVIEPTEITSMADIEYRGGSPTPSYSTWLYDERYGHDILSYLYYLRDGINIDDPEAKLDESWIWVRDSKQLRTATKYVGDTTISHKSGYTLYYKIGSRYLKLPTSLSDVNLQAAMVDDVYQVCEQKDVPLYYIPTEGGPYQPINKWSDLLAAVEAGVWCKINDDYYPVELTEIDDDKAADGKYYEGLYQGIGGYRLKVNCPVYVHNEFNDFSGYSPVLRLNEILLQTYTADVPVSNEDIQYAFEEVWHEEDWDGVWDSNKEKPKIFIEEWTGQSGTMVTGTLIEAKIVNWYKNIPGEGYLAITEVGGDPNESFLYRITNTATGESLIVSVKGDGVTYVYAPLGEYTIEEITDWAWRYEDGKCVSPATGTNRATVTVTSENDTPENAMHADFTNKRNEKFWIGGESSKDNQFGSETTDEEPGANSRKQEYAMPTVAYDFEKKRHDQGDNQ